MLTSSGSGTFWTVQCSQAELLRLAQTDGFAAIVNLARAVNALRFAVDAYPAPNVDTPRATRQRLNAFMCSVGFLHEALDASKRVGEYWRHLPAFDALSQSRKLAPTKRVLTAIRALRNASVFHFDQAKASAHLRSFEQDPCVFACGIGDLTGDSYYELAGIAALQALIGMTTSSQDWTERHRSLAVDLGAAVGTFATSADDVIAEALASLGFELVEGAHPHEE